MSLTCPNCDSLVDFDLVPPGAEVRVAGEWQRVEWINRSRRTLRLQPVNEGRPWGEAWDYEILPGELLTLRDAF